MPRHSVDAITSEEEAKMPVSDRMRTQVELILSRLDGAAAYPAPDRWSDPDVNDVSFLYREYTILAYERDADRVEAALTELFEEADYGDLPEGDARQILREDRIDGTRHITRFMVPQTAALVPAILDQLDRVLEPDVARPDHILYVCPLCCPATEPMEVPAGTVDPVPPPGLNTRCCCPGRRIPWPDCDGDGVSMYMLDTGLIPDADAGHPWLAGVQGEAENPYIVDSSGNTVIAPYAGHGTFVAGVARCMAPKASAYVERAFTIAGADFETNLIAGSLKDALDHDPDILVCTFTTSSRHDKSLLTFDDVLESRIRYMKGLVVLAAAGCDGQSRPMWPAAYREVIAVGALSANWRDRAEFSNYGKWVDVYAPGEDLVNAFPTGTYVCNEPPVGEIRHFYGMAQWSGTSFSTPVVAGLIAARMSATAENAQQAADSLLRLACRQAVPGIGAVLYPGQACDDEDDTCGGCGRHGRRARCGCGGGWSRGC